MSYIAQALRQQVITRANGCCEYCRLHQDHSLYTHEIDHIIPEKHRGKTTLDNLCLACLDCNRHKGSDFASFDPATDAVVLLFNPRRDVWQEHFRLNGARIEPLTEIGRTTVFILKLNDALRLRTRHALLQNQLYPCTDAVP